MTIVDELLANDPASQLLGIELLQNTQHCCVLTMLVTEKMTNGYHICHGGFVFTLADTASAFACAEKGKLNLSSSNMIDYLSPAKLADRLTATATVTLSNGRNIFCDVKVTNQDSKVIAMMRSKLISKSSSA